MVQAGLNTLLMIEQKYVVVPRTRPQNRAYVLIITTVKIKNCHKKLKLTLLINTETTLSGLSWYGAGGPPTIFCPFSKLTAKHGIRIICRTLALRSCDMVSPEKCSTKRKNAARFHSMSYVWATVCSRKSRRNCEGKNNNKFVKNTCHFRPILK